MLQVPVPQDRRSTFLRAARICFLDRGFLRTSISDIIAIAGGSRATIYEMFGSKEGLFAALIADILEGMRLPNIEDGSPETVLAQFAKAYLDQLLDVESLALYRVALGEGAHVRALGPAIFKAGPEAAVAALAERLGAYVESSELELGDPVAAARMFLGMVEGDLHRAAILWKNVPGPEQVESHVAGATALFLQGARPRKASEGAY